MKTTAGVLLLVLTLSTLGAAAAAASGEDTSASYESAVVGLNVTFQRWDEDRPWVKLTPETRRVSAVMVGPKQFLTTADDIDFATNLQLTTNGRARQAPVRIERIDRSVDLALVDVDDAPTLSGLTPVAIGAHTPTSGTLRTARWRGQKLEVAASRVIRLEVERALTSDVFHAVLHMKTDLSAGGWSEPVFDGSSLVGITFTQFGDESRAVPAEMLDLFLKDAAAGGPVRGVASLGVNWQWNRDSAVTRFLGQEGEPRGILVRSVPWGTTGCGALKPRDIVLSIGGESIDAEGYFRHPSLGRLNFDEILAERYRPGDAVPVSVLRGGQEQKLTLTARSSPSAMDLVPRYQSSPPPYLVVGGLVVRELDVPYLRTWGKEWDKDAPQRLLSRFAFEADGQTPDRRRIVVISAVLPSPYNLGYQDLKDVIVDRVNRRPIRMIEDVVEALKTPDGRFDVFTLSPESPRDEIVFDAATLAAATSEILTHYEIPAAYRAREELLPEGDGDCRGDF